MDSSSEVASTEEAMKAFLEHLVDPMLPLKVSSQNPPLSTQQSVAKQMHAVVVLYNYYHRKQHPELQFLEFEHFCKLALTLKPALIAHMKFMRQDASTGLDNLENQLSVVEKAIMEACNTSKALDALKDVLSLEGWPVSKVSVLLVDSRKENCMLIFDSITKGTWSIVEKCLDISNLHSESPSVGKRKQTRRKAQRGKESTKELDFREVAFSAVEEAAGINQSKLMVLESNVVYSFSKENTAAYFYIMQCTESSTGDFQVPIKDAVQSLQGPLLKRVPGSWELTPKAEHYSMLPYARIIFVWLSRESNSSQILNVSSCQRTEDNYENRVAESEKVTTDGLLCSSVHLANENIKSFQIPEKPCDGEVHENRDSSVDYNSTESIVAVNSGMAEKEVENGGKPDKFSEITPLKGSDLSSFQISEKPCNEEAHENGVSNVHQNSKEAIFEQSSCMAEKEFEDRGKPDKCCEITPLNGTDLSNFQSPEKSSDGEVHENKKINANYNCKEVENTGMTGKEVEDRGKADKCCAITSLNGSYLSGFWGPEKPCDEDVDENSKSNFNYSTKEAADNSGLAEKKVEDREKPYKGCDITPLNSSYLMIVDPETSKMLSADDFHVSPDPSSKRQRMDVDGFGVTCPMNVDENKNSKTPFKVYHHRKRKISVESNVVASTNDVNMKVATAKTINADNSDSEKGKTVARANQGNILSTIHGIPAADYALVPLETNGKYVQKLLASKENEMTRAALRVLFRKRIKLCHQQREVEDEIALCDRDIQKVLDGDGDDSLALKLEAIINCCNDTCLKAKTRIHEESREHGESQSAIECIKGKALSDAILTLQSPCQDLDDISQANYWAFPMYSMSASDGGFLASVIVKGIDFDCSCSSALLSTPQAARESAASQMITKLREMAGLT